MTHDGVIKLTGSCSPRRLTRQVVVWVPGGRGQEAGPCLTLKSDRLFLVVERKDADSARASSRPADRPVTSDAAAVGGADVQ